jgi:tripartite-type tricarboxylate transporter receptor subunit TctC
MGWFRVLIVAPLAIGLNMAAHAQPQTRYPLKAVTLVVPYPAGGPMDLFARLVAEVAEEQLGQRVLVDNRGGAGGVIGTRLAMRAAPDGYTLVWGTSGTLGIAPILYQDIHFDPRMLRPVAMVARLPHVLAVHPSVPAHSVAELVQYGKANPGKLSFGASLSTPPHLLGALFAQQAGLDVLFVPDKGAATATLDLLAGRTQFSFDSMTASYPLIKQGKLRPLAVVDEARWPLLPNLPTMAESGFPQFTLSAYCGVLAPASTPSEIVNKLNTVINTGLAADFAKARLLEFNAFAQPGSPSDFATYMARMNKAWAGLVEHSGAVSR